MIHLLNRTIYLAFGLLYSTVVLASSELAKAQDAPPPEPSELTDFAQLEEPVLPFTDVPPNHWAYQALLNLASTYGCVSGYPDGTFRGEAAVTRYEFAAGMDACLGALTGLLQQQGNPQQEVDALIEAMEQSLEELRGLDQEVQQLEAD